eukprot:scaffold74658_cov69-Phaeocystis_antarctica.AAC.3
MCAAGFTFNVFIKSYETISVVISETRVSGECAETLRFILFVPAGFYTPHDIAIFGGLGNSKDAVRGVVGVNPTWLRLGLGLGLGLGLCLGLCPGLDLCRAACLRRRSRSSDGAAAAAAARAVCRGRRRLRCAAAACSVSCRTYGATAAACTSNA